MKSRLKRFLTKLVLLLAGRLGINYEVTTQSTEYLDPLHTVIDKSGFKPLLVVDIGANHGNWTRQWKNRFSYATFVLVEPQNWLQSSFADLLDDKTTFLPIGAGRQDGIMNFTINGNRDDSSTFLYTPEEAKFHGFTQIEVPVKTLNSIVRDIGLGSPDVVKIDAEGLDIDVLEGATDLFGKTELFLVEASINSTYSKTSALTIINYMDSKGYRVFDITDINRPFANKILWLVELAFVRQGGFFDNVDWDSK